ncbi:MAG: calcium-binding protein [Nocardioides sp.]
MTRTARALLVAAASVAGLVAPALGAAGGGSAAAVATAGTVDISGGTLIFRAAPGDANAVTVADDKSGHIAILETPPDPNPITSADCRQDGLYEVDCDARFVTRVVLHLGDRDDAVFTDIPWWMPSAAYTVYGGAGDDYVRGNGGGYADTLYGERGDDRLMGYSGHDRLVGGPGSDDLLGMAGDDVMRGGLGGDELRGGDGSDTMFGGAGADRLLAGAGVDTLAGGAGADQLFSTDDTLDFLYGGPGTDSAAHDPEDVLAGIETRG